MVIPAALGIYSPLCNEGHTSRSKACSLFSAFGAKTAEKSSFAVRVRVDEKEVPFVAREPFSSYEDAPPLGWKQEGIAAAARRAGESGGGDQQHPMLSHAA